MKLRAINDILYGAKTFKAGEAFETDERTAGFLLAQGWVVEDASKKTAKKKK